MAFLLETRAGSIPVIDITAIARQIDQIRELQKQLEEAKKIYETTNALKDSMNGITDIKDIARLLNDKDFRDYLPREYSQYSSGGNAMIRQKTERLAKQYDYYTREGKTPANDFYYNELKRQKGETYQDLAIAETVYDQASKRADELNILKNRLETASTPKEVMDLQTRIMAESALLLNEINRMQGMAMIQNAHSRIDDLREDAKIQEMNDQIENAMKGKR